MNRLCWRASLLACALFSGGLALAQFPGYTAMSRYSYNPMTGTTTQSQGYYNPYTGAGGRSFSVSNPYTGGTYMGSDVQGMDDYNMFTGGPDPAAVRNFLTPSTFSGRGGSFKTYYNASTGTRLERQVAINPYTGTVHTSGSGYNYLTGGGGLRDVDANPYTGGYRATGSVYNVYTGASANSEQSYNAYTGTYRSDRNSFNPYTGNLRSSSVTTQR